MIIDAHAHYTTAPPELQAYRGRQVMSLAKPPRARLQISDEQLERSMRNQFKRMMPIMAKVSNRTIGYDFLYLRDWGT